MGHSEDFFFAMWRAYVKNISDEGGPVDLFQWNLRNLSQRLSQKSFQRPYPYFTNLNFEQICWEWMFGDVCTNGHPSDEALNMWFFWEYIALFFSFSVILINLWNRFASSLGIKRKDSFEKYPIVKHGFEWIFYLRIIFNLSKNCFWKKRKQLVQCFFWSLFKGEKIISCVLKFVYKIIFYAKLFFIHDIGWNIFQATGKLAFYSIPS